MAFPDDTLPLVVRAYIGGDWRDLSDRLDPAAAVTITRGGRDGAATAAAASCNLALRDDDGALTPRNPLGQWYPGPRRGSPFWLGYRRSIDTFGRTSTGWGTATSGETWTITSGLAASYPVSAGVGYHSFAAANALRSTVLSPVLADTEQVVDVSVPAAITGAAAIAGVQARWRDNDNYYWMRAEFQPSSTAVVLRIAKTVANVDTTLATVTVAGLAYAATVPLRIRASCVGTRLAVKVWTASAPEPADWHVTATDSALSAPGQVGLRTWLVSGNSNATPFAVAMSGYELLVPRISGTGASYKPTLTPTTDGTLVSTMQIQLGGTLRRLGQGTSPLRSALTRYLPSTNPVAWWPMEDGVASNQVASGVASAPPMVVESGQVEFQDEAPAGASGSLRPTSDANPLVGVVVGGSSSAWQAGVWVRAEQDVAATLTQFWPLMVVTPSLAGIVLFTQRNSSNVNTVGVNLYPPGYPDTGTATVVSGAGDALDGQWHLLQVMLVQNGADTDVFVFLDGVQVAAATRSGSTLGAPLTVRMQSQYLTAPTAVNLSDWGVSQTTVHNGSSLVSQYEAGTGYASEPAGTRMLRLGAETGEEIQVVGDPAATMAMGPQRPETLVSLLQECADADGGLLHEGTTGAVRYVTRASRYNRPVELEIDLGYPYGVRSGESARVLTPVYDDQGLRNDVTATRTDGSSARVVDEASVAADGRYDTDLDVNVATDNVLADIAAWVVYLGTVEEARFPLLPLDLAANPEYVDAWLNTDVAARIRRTSSLAPQADIPDQVMAGYNETLGPTRWDIMANCIPASPWDVAEVGGEARVAADGSTLAVDLDPGDGTLSLASTPANGVWTTNPTDFPLDLRVGGDLVVVSAISGTTSPQTATVSSWSALRTWPAGTPVDVYLPAIVAL